uniref:Uncharacterized protein n=1 Tax=Lepeophtheirus salmonis TaxID=72036 RepID=A0A0K2TTR6_LEPSM
MRDSEFHSNLEKIKDEPTKSMNHLNNDFSVS